MSSQGGERDMPIEAEVRKRESRRCYAAGFEDGWR